MLNSSPLIQYQALVRSNKIFFDPAQQRAVELLQELYLILLSFPKSNNNERKGRIIKGVYLWGKVGRGKTFLMDLFVSSLPSSLCKRQHFHHFMQDVYRQLKALSGTREPLQIIAEQFSKQHKVLCFDEFFVSDIGDAMILGSLLQFMFKLNIVVVSTSNCAPDELYRNGLQRVRFLPAIAAIEQYTQSVHLAGEHDHRHRTLIYAQNYFELPDNVKKQNALHQSLLNKFHLQLPIDDKYGPNDFNNSPISNSNIRILGRLIHYIAKNNKAENRAICFDFSSLCQGPRSHFDYVELAKQFDTLLLFNVPPMSGQAFERIKARGTEDNGANNPATRETGEREVVLAPMDDAARRFIALVDECYDCNLNLVITAFVPQTQLYNNGSLLFEFERTKSRLIEMASMEYLAKTVVNPN